MWRFTRNNGITEGFRTRMEVMQRQACGFRNFENYRQRVQVLCSWRGLGLGSAPAIGVEPVFGTVAPRHGFEPRFTAPKAAVLPLDDRGELYYSNRLSAR